MKKKKKLLSIVSAALILVLTIVPIFASSNTGYISIYDGSVNSTIEVTITSNYNAVQVRYDEDDSLMYIETGIQDQFESVYSMYFNSRTYADITIEVNGDITFGQINPSLNIVSIIGSTANTPSTYMFTVDITIYGANKEYSQDELNQYGSLQFDLGVQQVLQNPSAYGLYTQAQRNEYGQSEYERGQKAGITTGASLSSSEAYNLGLQQGHKDSDTLKGIANVTLSSIYNTFIKFTDKAGIFGTSLIAILVSGVIILIVYFIFKLERS